MRQWHPTRQVARVQSESAVGEASCVEWAQNRAAAPHCTPCQYAAAGETVSRAAVMRSAHTFVPLLARATRHTFNNLSACPLGFSCCALSSSSLVCRRSTPRPPFFLSCSLFSTPLCIVSVANMASSSSVNGAASMSDQKPPISSPFRQQSSPLLSSNTPIAIPPHTPGFRLGSPAAQIQVEVFVDLQCPYSAKAFAYTLQLHQRHPNDVSFIYLPLVLPAHRQAYYMLKSSLAAALTTTSPTLTAASSAPTVSSTWIAYVGHLYTQVDRFSSRNHYMNKTEEDLLNHVSRCVLEFHHEDEPRFDQYYQLIKSEALDEWAKQSIRLAAKRGVVSTPTFFVNGSECVVVDSSSTDKWEEIIKQLLANGKTTGQ